MRYRLLIFDFDGTLADTYPAFERAFREVLPRFGLRAVSEEEMPRLRGMSARELISFLGLPLWKVPRVAKFMREHMASQPLRLFAGMRDILCGLADAGLTLAIVSSNSEANVRAALGSELAARFALFACGASLFGKAPKFRHAMKRTGTAPAHTLTIGDELRDAEAATVAGIDFGAVAWGYTDAAALQRSVPAIVFGEPADLLSVLSLRPAH